MEHMNVLLLIVISIFSIHGSDDYKCDGMHDINEMCYFCVNEFKFSGLLGDKKMQRDLLGKCLFERRRTHTFYTEPTDCPQKMKRARIKVECWPNGDYNQLKYGQASGYVGGCENMHTGAEMKCYTNCYPASENKKCGDEAFCAGAGCTGDQNKKKKRSGEGKVPCVVNKVQGYKLFCRKASKLIVPYYYPNELYGEFAVMSSLFMLVTVVVCCVGVLCTTACILVLYFGNKNPISK